MSTEVKHEGIPPISEPDTTGILTELSEAARELAQYASYAEIIGAIGHNRQPIRKWCDEIFRLCRKLDDIQWEAEHPEDDATPTTEEKHD
jgi:hypothetical protein